MTDPRNAEAVLAETAAILDAELALPRVVAVNVNDPRLVEALARAHSHVLRADGSIGTATDEQWAILWPRMRVMPQNALTLGRLTTAILDHGHPLDVEHGPDTLDGRPQHRHVTPWHTG